MRSAALLADTPQHLKPRPETGRDVRIFNPHDCPVEIVGEERNRIFGDDRVGSERDRLGEKTNLIGISMFQLIPIATRCRTIDQEITPAQFCILAEDLRHDVSAERGVHLFGIEERTEIPLERIAVNLLHSVDSPQKCDAWLTDKLAGDGGKQRQGVLDNRTEFFELLLAVIEIPQQSLRRLGDEVQHFPPFNLGDQPLLYERTEDQVRVTPRLPRNFRDCRSPGDLEGEKREIDLALLLIEPNPMEERT